MGKTRAAEHLDVGPGDDEDGSGSPWCASDSVDGLGAAGWNDGMGRKEGCEMFGDADWSEGETGESGQDTFPEVKETELTPLQDRRHRED